MGVETQKFIRKPLYVEAVRVTEANFDELVDWCQGEVLSEPMGGKVKKYIKVRVHHPTKNPRQTKAFVGDWLLYTEFGGYKVYTNKAFRATFDEVEEADPSLYKRLAEPVEAEPDTVIKPLRAASEVAVARANEEGIRPSPAHETPQGEPHEYVEASPAAIAGIVNEQEQARAIDEETPQPDPVPEQPPEDAAAGKRVLSVEEQRQMGPDAVRELVQSGEVVLAQDLAA